MKLMQGLGKEESPTRRHFLFRTILLLPLTPGSALSTGAIINMTLRGVLIHFKAASEKYKRRPSVFPFIDKKYNDQND